ncbi:MAG: hypothetical protein AAGA08_17485 [Pseudomonadota bacterium]
MQVSHFELIFKLQSPAGPADTVLQGYFLEISNLEDVPLSYALEFVTSSTSDPDRSLFENTFVIVDVPNADNDFSYSLLGGLEAKSFRLSRSVTVPACATALVAVLPSDPFSEPGCPPPTPDFEARGFVNISLPAQLQITQGPLGPVFSFEPQLDRPARTMLTPQNRATYFSEAGAITDQTQATVPTASGAALTEITPLSGFQLQNAGMSLALEDMIPNLVNEGVDAARLGAMLALAQASGMDLKAFNTTLREAGVPLALENRSLEKPKPKTRAKENA